MRPFLRWVPLFMLCFGLALPAPAWEAIDLAPLADGAAHWQNKYGRDRNDARRDPADIVGIAEHMCCFQNSDGCWPKSLEYQLLID